MAQFAYTFLYHYLLDNGHGKVLGVSFLALSLGPLVLQIQSVSKATLFDTAAATTGYCGPGHQANLSSYRSRENFLSAL